jgi:hypothetical protein
MYDTNTPNPANTPQLREAEILKLETRTQVAKQALWLASAMQIIGREQGMLYIGYMHAI